MPPTKLISSTEAARRKGVSRHAIYKAIRRGAVEAERIGRAVLIVDDERFAAYHPQPYRGRTRHRND